MLVTILTIPLVQSAEAIKSDGTPTSKTLSKQICGVSFCDTEQEWSIEDNINEHIGNLLNSQEDFVTQSADTDENGDALQSDGINSKLPHIFKTILLPEDKIMVQYSDGSWQILSSDNSNFFNEDGSISFSFGGQLGDSFGGNSMPATSLGNLQLSESKITIPDIGKIGTIEISGNVGTATLPNLLLTISYPDNSFTNFIMPVNNDGAFSIKYFYDHNTVPGTYWIRASYQEFLVGVASFAATIESGITSLESFGVSEETDELPENSVTVLNKEIFLPKSTFQSTLVELEGVVGDYHRGEYVVISLVFPDGEEKHQRVLATRDGFFQTMLSFEKSYPEGDYGIIIEFRNQEIARNVITVLNPEDG